MTNEFKQEVIKELNSISALAVEPASIDFKLQKLISEVCHLLQAPAALLLLTDEWSLTLKAFSAGTDEPWREILYRKKQFWSSGFSVKLESAYPMKQTITDEQEQLREIITIPLIIGNQRLGTIVAAAPHSKNSSLIARLQEQVGLVLLVLKNAQAEAVKPKNESWFTEEFLAMLSHELRAPLHAILGWVSVLQHPATNKETWEHALKTIERSARAQSHIINDLLDASFCFNQQPDIHKRSVSVHSLLQQVMDSLLPVAEQKGVILTSDIRLADDYVMADVERLRQAFWHLLSNAIKFTPRKGQVQLLAQRADDSLEFTLVDSGIGITPDFMPHIFDLFQQESARTTRKFGGLGLGLAIADHQIKLHGGTLEVRSAGKNQGVTVVVRLPLETPLKIKGETRKEVMTRPDVNQAISKKDLQSLRVLVVADDADSLEVVRTILQNCDSEVRTATSAQEALEVLKYWEPDVLISDLRMPGIDGYELIRKIRHDRLIFKRRVATIALTAHSRGDERLKALVSGFHTHLSKPVNPTELVAVVTSLQAQPGQLLSLT